MQGRLVQPPILKGPGNREAEARHNEALGVDHREMMSRENAWMSDNGCRYWLPDGNEALSRLDGDAPSLLFVRGEPDMSAPAVAIVGSRKADEYGLEMTLHLSRALAGAGINIISGGAIGIDRAAHEGALDAGGRTTVVLGSGLAVPHPRSNRDLFDRVIETGSVIISEYPVGVPAAKRFFPERNRIIAALADAVVVMQAGKVSGALITATWATGMRIPVFATPADAWYREYTGCLDLLKKGASPLTRPSDLSSVPELAELASMDLPWPDPGRRPRGLPPPWRSITTRATAGEKLDASGAAVLRALSEGPLDLDVLADKTKIPAGRLQADLLKLEICGRICRIAGGRYLLED